MPFSPLHRLRSVWRHGCAVTAVGAFLMGARGQEFQVSYDLDKAPGAAVDAPNVKAYGQTAADGFGRVIRSGDINGDGIDDLIIGTPGADPGTPVRPDAGAVYVWFGKETLAGTKDVAATQGVAPDMTILGATDGDQLSRDGALLVTDVDGDGVGDLVIGALLGDGPGDARPGAGEAYLIYGRDSEETFPAVIDLRVQGSGGADVTFFGGFTDDQLTIGGAIAVGDVNGDGRNDVLLGSVLADGPGEARPSSGEAYVIFGRAGGQLFPTTLDLAVQGSAGADVTIYGATANDFLTFGGAIGVGDVNEDGLLDIILGARDADGPGEGRSSAGEAYLVFGRAEFPATLDLAIQGSAGADVTLYGASSQDQLTSGGTLAVGDVNGDGRADLLLGAPGGDGPGEARASAGEAYIISGRENFPLTLDLSLHGSSGASATIYGASAQDQLTSGGSLAVGDVNGDGFTDLLVGAALADGPGEARASAGEAYIVLGGASFPETMDLNPAAEGDHADVTIYGASTDDNLTIEGALTVGDVDGDGAADLLLGARLADGPGEGRNNGGEAYIVLGRNPFPATIDLAVQGIGGADVTVYGATGGLLAVAQDQLTSSAALSSGDVDGDGFGDFIVGAIAADGPGEERPNGGEAYVIFGTGSLSIAPDIAVEQPAGTNIPDGGSRFGSILIGANTTRTFTVKNNGLEVLTDLAVGKEGANGGDYTVGDLPATSLAPGASLTFPVTFTPSAVGSRSAVLRILSNDPNENPFDIVMTGNGVAPEIDVEQPVGTLLEGGAAYSFGPMHTGGQGVRVFTIRNVGSADLGNLAVSKEGPQADEYLVGALGSTTVPAGGSTTFTVAFAPTGLGTRSATLSITSNDADENPFVFEMTGIGKLPAPEITLEQPAGTERLDQGTVLFGAVPVGSQGGLTIIVKNTGSATLNGLAVSKAGAQAGEYPVGALGSTSLAPGGSTTFQVTFEPASSGVRTANLEIASNDEDENPFRLTLSGIGVDPEIVMEEPAGTDVADGGSREFGAVLIGESASKTFTIRNTGTTDLTEFVISKEGNQAGDFVVGALGMEAVPPGESTTFTVTFMPTFRGACSAVLRLANNDGNESPFDIQLTGTGLAPEIAVEGPDGTGLTDNVGTLELNAAVIEEPAAAQTFVIRNLGNSAMTGLGLTKSGAASGDFVLGKLAVTQLAAGESTTFTVTFSPLVAGSKEALIQVTSNDADESPFEIAVKAEAYPREPVFQPQTLSRWALLGQPMTLEPVVTGSNPKTWQWYKGTTKIAGAAGTGATFGIAKVKATDANVYSARVTNGFAATPVVSPNIYVGVVTRGPANVTLNAGKSLKMVCTAVPPKGMSVTYEWRRDGVPVADGDGRISGASTSELEISRIRAFEAGVYTCQVIMAAGGETVVGDNGETVVTVVETPTVEAFTLDDAYVAEDVNFVIPTTKNPTSFTVTGLPSGVTVSKAGVLSGKPKAAKVVKGQVVPYVVKVIASNSAGKSEARLVNWTIRPLDPGAIGTFNGLVERRSPLNSDLGGSIKVVTTSAGGLTGTLKLGALSYALKGGLTTPKGGGNPGGDLTIVRKAPLSNLSVVWSIDVATGELVGEVDDAASEPAAMKAWRLRWSSKDKAADYAYSYTGALTPEAAVMGNPALYPQGEGYVVLTVSNTGGATWGGKLADGSVITGGTTLGPTGEVALQTLLYGNTGSVQGWCVIDDAGNLDGDGVLDWGKAAQPLKSTTRSYKEGFALHELTLTGGRYLKPTGTVLNLPAGTAANAQFEFGSGGLEDTIVQSFVVTDKNAVQMPKAGDENPAAVKVTKFVAGTGLFSGSFTLNDPDPLDTTEPIGVLKRTATFEGVIVPRLGRGAGFFLLQGLPQAPGETMAKTAILSGGMIFGAATP